MHQSTEAKGDTSDRRPTGECARAAAADHKASQPNEPVRIAAETSAPDTRPPHHQPETPTRPAAAACTTPTRRNRDPSRADSPWREQIRPHATASEQRPASSGQRAAAMMHCSLQCIGRRGGGPPATGDRVADVTLFSRCRPQRVTAHAPVREAAGNTSGDARERRRKPEARAFHRGRVRHAYPHDRNPRARVVRGASRYATTRRPQPVAMTHCSLRRTGPEGERAHQRPGADQQMCPVRPPPTTTRHSPTRQLGGRRNTSDRHMSTSPQA